MDLEAQIRRIKEEESEFLIPNHRDVYEKIVKEMARPFIGSKINKVVSIETKGLMYGPVIADRLGVPLVAALKRDHRKKKNVTMKSFVDYSRKRKSVLLFRSSITKKDRVLVVDDWFETGNTGRALISLIHKLGGKVAGITIMLNQLDPSTERFFKRYNFHYLVRLERK